MIADQDFDKMDPAFKDADGTFSGFDLADLDEDGAGDFVAFAGATTGLLGVRSPRTATAIALMPGSPSSRLRL